MDDRTRLNRRDVQRRFDQAAATFDKADFVHAVTREGIIARLAPLLLDARAVLDLGAATGGATAPLRKRFRRATIVSVDLSHSMLRRCASKRRWWSRAAEVQGDAASLPFADDSFDLVFANLLLPWIDTLAPVLQEVARVLRKGGVFAFATLGPDSFAQLGRAWAEIDSGLHVNRFPDMHDVGDALLRAGLSEPVLDVDHLSVRYDDPHKLFRDLTAAGARNALEHRNRSLFGKGQFGRMLDALPAAAGDKTVEIDLELVYGHCWGAAAPQQQSDFRINANKIGVRGKSRDADS
ncbi:MAG: methyltransferase domain-containing protein [Gammaproteobacteria bacterium]|nr:methyltransferase domain-containing protein [Gammaproteobacteria bacterium]